MQSLSPVSTLTHPSPAVLALLPTDTTAAPRSLRRRIGVVVAKALTVMTIFMITGNLLILVAWKWEARHAPPVSAAVHVTNFRVVDDHVWRGAAPDDRALRELAAKGVTTVVDLRAEDGLHVDTELLDELGLERVTIPMRDGQTPTSEQVDRFLAVVAASKGPVFVHCGAGVGRTGTMVAAYLVHTGEAGGLDAVRRNLSVGPPSLEQLVFAATLHDGETARPPVAIVAASRVLDAPRRIWTRLTG